jgi:hypothetical protein
LFLKILVRQDGAAILKAPFIHGVTLKGERLNDAGSPLAELHRTLGVDLVAHCDDGG